jgi:hypothetical protein
MTIRLTCPACRAKLTSKTALLAGARRKCPRCGRLFRFRGHAAKRLGSLGICAVLTAAVLFLLVLPGILLAVCLSGGAVPQGGGDHVATMRTPSVSHWLPAVSELPPIRPPAEPAVTGRQAVAETSRETTPPVAESGSNLVPPAEPPQSSRLPVDDGTFTGPYTYKNLSVYLIHGPDTLPGSMRLVTLEEALMNGQVSLQVAPGGASLQNRSGAGVFVQGGDILKGAFQDQAVAQDYLVGPDATQTGTLLSLNCVEHGRSGARGSEPIAEWHSAPEQLPGTALRLALSQRNQQAIWDGVAKLQDRLRQSVGESVADPVSPTSLALTLDKTRPLLEGYVKALSAPGASADAVGVVVVVDGKILSADEYASHELFLKLWPKLLRAGAVAALAEPAREPAPALPTAVELHSFLAGDQGVPAPLTFSLRDPAHGNVEIHRAVWSS